MTSEQPNKGPLVKVFPEIVFERLLFVSIDREGFHEIQDYPRSR